MKPSKDGTEFEQTVFNAITKAVKENRLGVLPSSSRIYQRRSYFSRDRNSNIEVDVSIEIHLPGSDTWSLLWIWECKDNGRPLSVDQVEEFWAKLLQIGGANIKGGLAVSGALQKSALAYARSKGIMVIRMLPKDRYSPIMYHSSGSTEESRSARRLNMRTEEGITNHDYHGDRLFFCANGELSFSSMSDLVDHVFAECQDVLKSAGNFEFVVQDAFRRINEVIVYGIMQYGSVKAEDRVSVQVPGDRPISSRVLRVEVVGTVVPRACGGDHICLVLPASNQDLRNGTVISNA